MTWHIHYVMRLLSFPLQNILFLRVLRCNFPWVYYKATKVSAISWSCWTNIITASFPDINNDPIWNQSLFKLTILCFRLVPGSVRFMWGASEGWGCWYWYRRRWTISKPNTWRSCQSICGKRQSVFCKDVCPLKQCSLEAVKGFLKIFSTRKKY